MKMVSRWAAAAILLAASAAVAAAKPLPCTLNVSPLRGDSRVSKSGGRTFNSCNSFNSSNSGSKTIERSMKWMTEVRFREGRPTKVELKVYHIGYGDGGKNVKVISSETKAVELDKNGCAAVELTSPTTRLTKTRTRSSSCSSGGFSASRTRTTGERVAGCIVQLFGDGELLKSWASDSRWASAAGTVPFSIGELKQKSGRIGLR